MDNVVNTSVVLRGQQTGDPTIKVPIVLAEPTIQIDVGPTTITLPEPAIEIKRITKRLKLTQCTLLQDTNKLFISGFVRKNIEYATVTSATATQLNGKIRHTTVDIDFSTVEAITFTTEPAALNFNTVQNFEYLKTQALPSDFPNKDTLESGDMTEFNQINTEYFNELPYCELVSSRIVEFDEFLNRTPVEGGPFEEMEFTQIQEKMTILITLKILQKRQIVVNGSII